jgi:predicted HTH domain antitoxin
VKNLGEKISIIIPEDMRKEMESIRNRSMEDQSTLVRRLLRRSLSEEKLDLAIKDYLEDKISIGKAAEFAGVSVWQMMDELKKRNIGLKYKLSEAQLEIERILKRYERKE